MKRITLSILLLLPLVATFANPIDDSTAKSVGYNFLLTKISLHKLSSAANLKLAYQAVGKDGYISFYIFNLTTAKGFVIVSGDDIATPILGYSTESNFDTATKHLPIQMKDWLTDYSKRIAYARNNKSAATINIKNRWEQLKQPPQRNKIELFGTGNKGVSPLMKTTWDQYSEYSGPPYTYNALCPYDNKFGAQTITGCVATAMAQVLKYWNYPAKGSGKHTYTPATYFYLGPTTANFDSTTYQWSEMPNNLARKSSSTQINAVATLMYDCGVSVNMDYGVAEVDGSGAYATNENGLYSNTAQDALPNNFGYDNSIQGLQRSNYTDSVWISMLENELNAKRPIIYTGSGNQGGHCFVADGYDSSNYFHFNWGWSGYFNGYFGIDDLTPDGDTFNTGQEALIGIQPRIAYTANINDSLALVALYNSTSGANWANNTGWLKGPLTTWYGVILNSDGKVGPINLSGNNLTGSIASSVENLTELTTLDLSNNNFSGNIPAALFNLSSLNTLDLSFNKFSGAIPNVSLTGLNNLSTMDLSNNQLTGTIPTSFNNLQNLYTLDLSNNLLSGTLPSLISDSSLLSILYLSNNNFTGTIPTNFLKGIPYMNVLDLSNNKFSGAIPTQLYKLPYLTTLDLSGNSLSGSISSSIGKLIYLSVLSLADNQFSGNIPSGISSLTQLTSVDLSNNHLSGSIPNVFSSLGQLFLLDISNNNFTFDGMNNIANLNSVYSNTYSPQATVSLHNNGGKLSITVGGNLSYTTYRWFYNSGLIATKLGDSTFITSNPGNYYVTATNTLAPNLTLFSDTITISPLPLTWLNFSAKPDNSSVQLNWQTTKEVNTDYFNIQHSSDGAKFSNIGKLSAIDNGTSSYSFTDQYPINETNYYCLESIDKDGTHSFSKVVSVRLSINNYQLSIAPNPARDYTIIHLPNMVDATTLSVYDITGRRVIEQPCADKAEMQLNVQSLTNGTYIVILRTALGNFKEKLIISK